MSGILDKPIVITVSARGSTGPQGETGNGIESITLLSESGLTKTYRITFTDGTHFDFAVSDGNGISGIEKTSTVGLVDIYTITYTDGTTATFTVTNGAKGDKGDKGNTGNGIASITKTGTSGLVDTYTITFTDGNTTTFTVTNGNAILSVSKTSTSGLTDTYTITFSDGTSTTYVVTNGKGIATIAKTSVSGLVDTYTITYNDDTTSTFTVTNGNGIASVEKTATVGLVDTYTITFTDGTNTTFEVTNGSDTWGAITGDIDDQADLHNALAGKAVAIEESLSGSLVTIEDGADGIPVKDLTVAIEPVQEGSGDPSPDNVRPITGRTGCNVYRTGKNLLPNLKYEATSTIVVLGQDQSHSVKTVYLKPGTYTLSLITDGVNAGLYYRKAETGNTNYNMESVNNIGRVTVDQPDLYSFWAYKSSGLSSDDILSFQLEPGSAATAHEAYAGTVISVSFPAEAGTVYRGTWDVTTGVLTVTDAQIASYNGETLPSTWISDRDAYASGTTPTTGAQVVYKLATPITYQLTPAEVTALLGMNNIWADTGDATVTYRADTKAYIDGQIAARDFAIKSLMTAVESSMTLTANRSSGDVVIVGDTFYKLTTNVASDSTLVVGTNCVVSNMAEWVLSLQL